MLRQGPISRFVHGAIEYVAGVLLIVSGFLLDFESSAAIAASIILGILVLILALGVFLPIWELGKVLLKK